MALRIFSVYTMMVICITTGFSKVSTKKSPACVNGNCLPPNRTITCPQGANCWLDSQTDQTLYINTTASVECVTIEPMASTVRKLSIISAVNSWPLCQLCNYPSTEEIEWKGEMGSAMNFTWSCLPLLKTIKMEGMNLTELEGNFLSGLNKVSSLFLSGNNIHFIAEGALGEGLHLSSIDFSENNLLSVPKDLLANQSELESFNVAHNALRHIPSQLFTSASISLKVLNLHDNQMISLSFLLNHSTFESLETLDVSYNKIESISGDVFHYLSTLLQLDLSYNSIRHIDPVLFRCGPSSLKLLNLAGNKLASLPDNAFQGLSGLVTLNLSHNSLQNLNSGIFEWAGYEGNGSTTCDSSDDYVTETGYNTKGNGFGGGLKKKDIVFHENSANGADEKGIVVRQVINMPWRKFHTFDASFNKINKISPDTFTSQLAYVRRIVLSYNRLQHLPRDSLEHLVYLESINVSHNRINWLDVGAFNNPQLHTIDLSYNRLTKIISMAFLYLPSLRTIDLSHNKINYIYKMAFYRTCKHGQSMKLDLSHNRLENDGLLKVVNCFRHLQDTACQLIVDLQQNSFTHFFQQPTTNLKLNLHTGDSKYFKTWDHINFEIAAASLECDCQMFYDIDLLSQVNNLFQEEFVRPENLKFWPDLTCETPAKYQNVSLKEFKEMASTSCKEEYGCPLECDCTPSIDNTIVDCSYRGLMQVPVKLPSGPKTVQLQGNQFRVLADLPGQYTEAKSINLSFSNVEYISSSAWQVMSNVKSLYLQGNQLNTLPVKTQQSCFNEFTLGGNPLQCGCPNQYLMEWILNCSDTVGDFEHIQCSDRSFFLDSFSEVCQLTAHSSYVTNIVLTLISMGITLFIGLLILFVGYRNRHIFTACCSHKRKWYKVHAEENNKYDVFVAYSSMDSDTIMFGLLPMLQRGGQFPSICLQHRDWQSRKTIFANFNESVQNTNAVIVVLSHHFLQTEFQSEEYRQYMAHLLSCSCIHISLVNLDGIDVGPIFRDLGVDNYFNVLHYDKEDFREQLLAQLPKFGERKYISEEQGDVGGILVECEKY